MRGRIKLKALFAAAAVAAGIGLAVPAQASAAETGAAQTTEVLVASGNTITCSGETPLPIDAASTANTCLAVIGDNLTASGTLSFNAADPTKWQQCRHWVSLWRVETDGTETWLGTEYSDSDACLTQAKVGGSISVSLPPVAVTTTGIVYKTYLGVLAEYDGNGMYQVAAESPAVLVWQ